MTVSEIRYFEQVSANYTLVQAQNKWEPRCLNSTTISRITFFSRTNQKEINRACQIT